MAKKHKVLILGGAGYVGGALTDYISTLPDRDNFDVLIYDNLIFEESYGKPFRLIQEDVRELSVLNHYLNWCDSCISLAASVGDAASAIRPEVTYDLNVEVPKHIVKRLNGKRLVTISSCSVYGVNNDLITEQTEPNPQSLYAVSKVLMERELSGSNSLVIRLGTLYGISDRFSRLRLDLVVNTLVKSAYYDQLMRVFGGEQYRPILHVRDTSKVLWDGITSNSERKGIYNLSAENVKIVELAQGIQKFVPASKLELTDIKTEDARNYRVDSQKAKDELSFNPKLSLADGIQEVLDLFVGKELERAFMDTTFDPNDVRFWNHKWLGEHGEKLDFDKDYSEILEKVKGLKLTSVT